MTRAQKAYPAKANFKVRVLHNRKAILGIEEEWRDLAARAGKTATVFQGFDWVYSWLEANIKVHGNSCQCPGIHIVVVWSGDELVGLWPLQYDNSLGVRSLCWATTPALQYGGVLISPDCDTEQVCQAAFELITNDSKVDLVQLDKVPESSAIFNFLSQMCKKSLASHALKLDLTQFANTREYQASIKKTARRARRKRLNKLGRQGDLSFEVHSHDEKYKSLIDTAIRWKRDWLKRRNWPAPLMNDPAFIWCLQNFANCRDPRSSIWRVAELSLDGLPIALEAGAELDGHYYSFLGAFDPTFAAYSPGKIEMQQMIEWCIGHNVDEFDFLVVPSQYKSDWTNSKTLVQDFSYAVNKRGKLFHSLWVKRMRPAVRDRLEKASPASRKLLFTALKKTPLLPQKEKS